MTILTTGRSPAILALFGAVIGYDPGQDLYVMTPEGARLYDHIVGEKGVGEQGHWTQRGIVAFTSWDRGVDLDLRSEISPLNSSVGIAAGNCRELGIFAKKMHQAGSSPARA